MGEQKYVWNSKCNSFDTYIPQYDTIKETGKNGEEVEKQVERAYDGKLYTQEEVNSIFANRGENRIIEDVNGVPTAVDLYTADEIVATLPQSEMQVEQLTISYDELVDSKIREKYSASQEFAILRQRDTKQEEFAEYNAYCEQCKAEARAEIAKA